MESKYLYHSKLIISCAFNRTQQMATTASTPSRSTIPPPWLGISPRRPGTPPAQGPSASSGFPRACPSPTSTPPLGLGLTAFMTTASALCWAWAAAPSSSVSVSSSAAHWATPVRLSTRSATAAWAATVNRKATCSLIKTARLRPRPPPTTLSPPRRTQTSRGRSRSVCRPTSDRQWGTGIEQDVQTAIGLWDWSSSDGQDVTLCSEHLETWGRVGLRETVWFHVFISQKSNWEALFFSPNNPLTPFPFLGETKSQISDTECQHKLEFHIWNLQSCSRGAGIPWWLWDNQPGIGFVLGLLMIFLSKQWWLSVFCVLPFL